MPQPEIIFHSPSHMFGSLRRLSTNFKLKLIYITVASASHSASKILSGDVLNLRVILHCDNNAVAVLLPSSHTHTQKKLNQEIDFRHGLKIP